jgi:para-nitrobenzyl esterase
LTQDARGGRHCFARRRLDNIAEQQEPEISCSAVNAVIVAAGGHLPSRPMRRRDVHSARHGWILLLCLIVTACRGNDVLPANQVRLSAGIVEGIDGTVAGVRAFLGIPYAASPAGDKRWTPPEPAAAWEGVRQANRFGDRCVQTTPFPDMVFRSPGESEDCLSLSIWTPAREPTERLPVMVWIHGGGFFSGASDEPRHEGSTLASKGVVLVAINYRLGVLGFLAHPELTAESERHASGNYGLLDQVAALRWVRDNIAAFGGDPEQVTIFGESAGSFSVSALMASPLAAGLFHRAIGESGGYFADGPLPLLPLAEAESRGSALADGVGAASLAELRSTPAAELVAAVGRESTRFAPIVDGYLLPAHPLEIFARGQQNDVPLIAGWNSAETKVPPIGAADFRRQLGTQFPEDPPGALAAYPAGSDREAHLSAVALSSDTFIGYNTWKWIETAARIGRSPVYRYLFDQIVPTADGDPAPDDPGAGHATEIEYVFHTLEARKLAWRDADRLVADLMTTYWTNFAKTGDPNGPGVPAWPMWDVDGDRRVLRIKANVNDRDAAIAEPESNRARYEFRDRIEQQRRAR